MVLAKRQEDLCELESSLVYRVSFRTAKDTQRNPVSKNKQTNKNITKMNSFWRESLGSKQITPHAIHATDFIC